jgi:hypothetical protein
LVAYLKRLPTLLQLLTEEEQAEEDRHGAVAEIVAKANELVPATQG